MVSCVLVMAPTGLECTQDMRNGTVAKERSHIPPRGAGVTLHRAPLFYNPRSPQGRLFPRPYAHCKKGARGVTGPMPSTPKHNLTKGREGHCVLSEIVHPSRKCVLSSMVRNKMRSVYHQCTVVVRWGKGGNGRKREQKGSDGARFNLSEL